MRYVVEDHDLGVHTIVNMFNAEGEDTDNKDEAVSIVFEDSHGDGFWTLRIPYPGVIHTVH